MLGCIVRLCVIDFLARMRSRWRCGGYDFGLSDEPGSTESDVLNERMIEQMFSCPTLNR
jgi:hypothetical protein